MKRILAAAALLGLSATAAAEPPQGDAERGRLTFGQCRTCHYPEKTYGDHNGPNLYGIFGRKAGSLPSYAYYSDEMKKAGFDWTPELLDFWLANQGKFLPNSTMVVFETTPQQRADIIAYLKQFRD
ncbi:adenylate cyclase [Solimonas sp. K1W22B-7]|uniref:c-type cytochrome n=1 Tax=Solimonas sp. K1W22B-7 TaxID=2303331 RepID=UPI000E32E537|nr:c-type cytochrome [Solimonas sp. K1W22B-7]AXQ28145.1 adenylate cyclase [Solimonas sp. K1W22B-7]